MVHQGCRGIRVLAESHKWSRISVSGLARWQEIFCDEAGDVAELVE